MTDELLEIERCLAEGPQSALERRLITEYLLSKGYKPSDLKKLPPEQLKALMREACRHAALELAEIESRAKLRREIKPPA